MTLDMPQVTPNTSAAKCNTRPTMVDTQGHYHPVSTPQSASKENSNCNTPSLHQPQQQVATPKTPHGIKLHVQFQSTSGPPKKRLSSKWNAGGKFGEPLQPVQNTMIVSDATGDSSNATPKKDPSHGHGKEHQDMFAVVDPSLKMSHALQARHPIQLLIAAVATRVPHPVTHTLF